MLYISCAIARSGRQNGLTEVNLFQGILDVATKSLDEVTSRKAVSVSSIHLNGDILLLTPYLYNLPCCNNVERL
jgi:hypothetical protein